MRSEVMKHFRVDIYILYCFGRGNVPEIIRLQGRVKEMCFGPN